MTVAEAIIGVLGAGVLGMLCLFYQSIKSDLRTLGTRLNRYEVILVDMVERLTRIETVQEEHGRQLAEHGRRLTRIEATLEEHGHRLTRIEVVQEEHGRRLADHGRLLADHGRLLADHDRLFAQMTGRGERIATLEGSGPSD